MFYGQHIMSSIVNGKGSEHELCNLILKLTSQPEALVKEEIKRVLRFGITNGFIVKIGNNYSLPSLVHVRKESSDSLENLFETDEAPVKADKIDLGFVDQLYESFMQAAKDDDVVTVFSFRNELRRINTMLNPQNYDDENEYQSVFDKHNEFSDELNGFIEDRVSDVRDALDYFRQNAFHVRGYDVAEFVICLTKLLLLRNFFDVARTLANDNQIRLSNADIRVWDEMSHSINTYFNVIYPGEDRFFKCDILEWTDLSQDGIIILILDSLKLLQVRIKESFESRNDERIYCNCEGFDKMVNEGLDNLKYMVCDLFDIPDMVDEIQAEVAPYLYFANIKDNLLEKRKEILKHIESGNNDEVLEEHEDAKGMLDDDDMEFISEKSEDCRDVLYNICSKILRIFEQINDDVKSYFCH